MAKAKTAAEKKADAEVAAIEAMLSAFTFGDIVEIVAGNLGASSEMHTCDGEPELSAEAAQLRDQAKALSEAIKVYEAKAYPANFLANLRDALEAAEEIAREIRGLLAERRKIDLPS